MDEAATYTAFAGESLIASGPLEKLLPVVKEKFDHKDCGLILIFHDETGKQVDFELRGTLEGDLAARGDFYQQWLATVPGTRKPRARFMPATGAAFSN